ncbi:hypothetical protein Bpfe_004217 [Biomphalaria pfeifferi]|uniref:Uncharacterized protein n=1 Tax=Biomphalaria pfeifferi TaxID=112525 RepID=A0AAD8FJT4_BIOPF|nr:hypothetical protein Bpfe_004217 [Biomphalaria pfeifferi]
MVSTALEAIVRNGLPDSKQPTQLFPPRPTLNYPPSVGWGSRASYVCYKASSTRCNRALRGDKKEDCRRDKRGDTERERERERER